MFFAKQLQKHTCQLIAKQFFSVFFWFPTPKNVKICETNVHLKSKRRKTSFGFFGSCFTAAPVATTWWRNLVPWELDWSNQTKYRLFDRICWNVLVTSLFCSIHFRLHVGGFCHLYTFWLFKFSFLPLTKCQGGVCFPILSNRSPPKNTTSALVGKPALTACDSSNVRPMADSKAPTLTQKLVEWMET